MKNNNPFTVIKNSFIFIIVSITLTTCTLKSDNQQANGAKKSKVEEANALPIIAGDYDFLSIATDGKMVTGFYSNGRYRGNPNFGCSFYFYGTLADSIGNRKITIHSLNPFSLGEKPRKGNLKLHSEEDTIVTIMANLNASQCWDGHLGWAGINEEPGVTFELYTKKPYLEIKLAKETKVYFYANNDETTKRKAYVIKNDPLFITERKGNWSKATYRGKNTETTGWVKSSELISFWKIGKRE